MQVRVPASLPVPDADSNVHSHRCADYIALKIRDGGGSISFAEYMQHALYAPALGYYSAGARKFGPAGDFVTAPEVSPVFGRIVARHCAPVLSQLGAASILEIGAGSGRLAVEMLKKLEELEALPQRYQILEVSADLQQRQARLLQENIPTLVDCVEWTDSLPENFRGVVIANEVLDALPVERFIRNDEIRQQRVVVSGDRFAVTDEQAPDWLAAAVLAIEDALGRQLPSHYVSELSPAAPTWLADVIASIDAGLLLLFDYGISRREYYAPERDGGWLRCHFRHHAHNDALILPGIQDITAWVDFSAIAAAAVDADARVHSYVNQALFLMSGGLENELSRLTSLPEAQQIELSAEIKMLTLPGAMGEHFKCMEIGKGAVSPLEALQFADKAHTL